jgi:hypothetical protein
MALQKLHPVYNQNRGKCNIVIQIVDGMHISVSPYIQNMQKLFVWTEQKLNDAFIHTYISSKLSPLHKLSREVGVEGKLEEGKEWLTGLLCTRVTKLHQRRRPSDPGRSRRRPPNQAAGVGVRGPPAAQPLPSRDLEGHLEHQQQLPCGHPDQETNISHGDGCRSGGGRGKEK